MSLGGAAWPCPAPRSGEGRLSSRRRLSPRSGGEGPRVIPPPGPGCGSASRGRRGARLGWGRRAAAEGGGEGPGGGRRVPRCRGLRVANAGGETHTCARRLFFSPWGVFAPTLVCDPMPVSADQTDSGERSLNAAVVVFRL